MRKPKFDHRRYLRIQVRKIFYFARVSKPFLSGDLFVALVDYAPWTSKKSNLRNALRGFFVLEPKEYKPRINKKKLSKAHSIFIPSHELPNFLEEFGAHLNAKVIISGNSDFNFTEELKLPKSVEICFLQNSAISNDNSIFTLPIGLENIALGRAGLKKYFLEPNQHEIFDRVLIPPMSPTNIARYSALLWGRENSEIADTHFELLPEEEYFELASKYKFVFCSEGNGFENHRIWESLYQGSFPILLNSPWSTTLKYLNLPILFVDNYDEITIETLKDFHEKNFNFDPRSSETLWEPYWAEQISKLRK